MGVPSRWVVTVELRKGLNPAPESAASGTAMTCSAFQSFTHNESNTLNEWMNLEWLNE